MCDRNICWNCNKSVSSSDAICNNCGKIQPPNSKDDFKLMGMDRNFNLDLDKLETSYLNLQQLFHPDKFSNLSEREKKYSTIFSSMINEAYQNLKNPVSRASLLLELEGVDRSLEENSFNDPEILEEIMEIQNKFLDSDDLESKKIVLKDINNSLLETTRDISKSFEEKKYDIAQKLNIKLSYLEKIKKDFKKQL